MPACAHVLVRVPTACIVTRWPPTRTGVDSVFRLTLRGVTPVPAALAAAQVRLCGSVSLPPALISLSSCFPFPVVAGHLTKCVSVNVCVRAHAHVRTLIESNRIKSNRIESPTHAHACTLTSTRTYTRARTRTRTRAHTAGGGRGSGGKGIHNSVLRRVCHIGRRFIPGTPCSLFWCFVCVCARARACVRVRESMCSVVCLPSPVHVYIRTPYPSLF